jgi:hypothetical protein
MNLFLIGFNGLLLMLVWRFILRRSILDTYRDKLFDLRDHLRETFVSRGWSLDSPLYRHLRDLINGYLRFTESYSFGEFVYMEIKVKENPALRQALTARVASKFAADTSEQEAFIADFRREAVGAMMSYMIVSSGPLLLLAVLMLPVALVNSAWAVVRKAGYSIFGKAIEAKGLCSSLVRLAIAIVANKMLAKDFVEQYSYRQATS